MRTIMLANDQAAGMLHIGTRTPYLKSAWLCGVLFKDG